MTDKLSVYLVTISRCLLLRNGSNMADIYNPLKKRRKVKKRATVVSTPKPRRARVDISTREEPEGTPGILKKGNQGRREKQLLAQREWSEAYRRRVGAEGRDIAPLPVFTINWERRLSCKDDLERFERTYMPAVFFKKNSKDQGTCIRKIEDVFLGSGKFALAMPRGGGKTANCRAGILWGTAFALKRFPFFIGSTHPKSLQTLEFIKIYWTNNVDLREDFPEIGYAISQLENRWHKAKGQIYDGRTTHIEYGADTLRYPCILLPEELAKPYLDNDPDALMRKSDLGGGISEDFFMVDDRYLAKSSGIIISTEGIEGSIRGEAEIHPITLEQPRPDVVLLDDIQKDAKAESPASVKKLLRLIDGAVQGLAGPGQTISALMPCTVIQVNDVSDTYLDRKLKPEWKGERCRLVETWPDGITDTEIGLDTDEGIIWNKYADERKKSYQLYEDNRLGTQLYTQNRELMDKGFIITWEERFDPKVELSAQQHAFNLRLTSPDTFPAEYQNNPRSREDTASMMIDAKQLVQKVVPGIPQNTLPIDCNHLVSFIDIQNEILFYTTFATSSDFTGVFIDYGTFPEVTTRYFRKAQTGGWGLLTRLFFDRYPEHRDKAIRTEGGRIRAPLEAKIYHALTKAVEFLEHKQYVQASTGQRVYIHKIGIDVRWGQTSDVAKRFCRECGNQKVVPMMGQSVPPTHRQFEEYTRTKGWMFEDQLHPHVKEVKWIYRPDKAYQYHIMTDVSRTKSWLMARLASPMGSPGSISLYNAPIDQHEMFADHLVNSEYPEDVTARGITKEIWSARDGKPDNDWLDCAVGCCSLASMVGASLKTTAKIPTRRKRSLSAKYASKRKG